MQEKILLEKLREYIALYDITDINGEHLEKVGLTLNEVNDNFSSSEDIITAILANERKSFEDIFIEYHFEDWNAIDIMLIVSNEIRDRFFNVSPFVTIKLAKIYPEIFQVHFQKRYEYILDKVKINIDKGVQQGMYNNDDSSEMHARMFIAKLNDVHNPEIYPLEEFEFATIFNSLIDSFIKTIATKDGQSYYKQRKQLYSILNFK